MEFFSSLLSPDFMPHGYCYLWDARMVWLHVISDGLIALSYYCIPVVLIYFIRKNRDVPFNRIFWMFGTFILACGTTHLMEIWNVWHGSYLLAGVIKGITAAVSVLTAAMLIPLVPKVVSLPGRMHLQETNRKLEQEIAERNQFDAPIDAPLRRRVTAGFIVAVLLTLFIGFSSWRSARRAEQDGYWVSHTHEVMEAIQRTSRHVIEAETSARAFALSGQEPLLMHYQTARDKIHQDEDGLRHLTEDNLSQQGRVDLLGLQVSAALAFAESIIAKRRKLQTFPGGEDAMEVERLLDVIRATTREMHTEEARLLSQRTQRAQAGQRLTRIIAIAGGFLAIGLWSLARFAVNREIDVSARARAQIITLNAELEQRVEQRTAALRSEIAERKRVEEAVREQAKILDLAQVMVRDTKSHILLWNLGAEKLYGYTREEAVGRMSHELLQTQFAEPLERIEAELDRTGTWEGELVHRKRDGSYVVVASVWVLHRDAEGRPLRVLESNTNVTERRLAEQALKKSLATSEAALQELADQKFALDQHAIVAVTDVRGTITYVNDKFCAISQYSHEELIGQNHRILNSGHHSKEFFQQMYHAVAQGSVWHAEIKNRAKDGSFYWVDTTIVPFVGADGKPRQYVAIRADITERKRAEEALLEQARILDLAQVMVRDTEGHIVLWNLGAEKLYGYTREEALGRLSHELLQTEFPEPLEQLETKLYRTGAWEGELVHRKRDGSQVIVTCIWVLHRDAQGQPLRILVSSTDITQRKRAEEALRESEERFQAMANGIPQLAWMAEADGSIFWYNQRWYEYTGTTFEQMAGWAWQSVHDPDVLPRVLEGWKAAIADGKPFEMEFPLRGADRRFRMFLTRVMPVKDAEGRVVRWFGTNTDISERQQANDRLAEQAAELAKQAEELAGSRQALEIQTLMLQSVLDSMTEGLAAVDEQGKFVIWNTAAEKILGMGATELPDPEWAGHYGLFLPDTVTPFPTDQMPVLRAIRGEVSTTEMFVRNRRLPEGAWIEVSAGPRKDAEGVVCGGVAAFRDVTRRKADEREIQKLNDGLELRVAERTAQLETANRELESFSYSVSHDLRAPLRHIGGFSKMLVEEFGPTLDPTAQHYLDRIQSGTQKMGLLVDELLNLARVGRHALNRQPTKLNSIVAEVIDLLQPDCQGREVEWVIRDLTEMQCDPVLVKQVFQNLLTNSLKFTRSRVGVDGSAQAGTYAPARAVIEVSCVEEDGQPVFMVRDNGVGFNMKYVDKLFGVFQRLHSAEQFEGTGIGLATVQRIVQKHGGRVWAEAEPDKGAAFYFTLSSGKQVQSKDNAATAGGRS